MRGRKTAHRPQTRPPARRVTAPANAAPCACESHVPAWKLTAAREVVEDCCVAPVTKETVGKAVEEDTPEEARVVAPEDSWSVVVGTVAADVWTTELEVPVADDGPGGAVETTVASALVDEETVPESVKLGLLVTPAPVMVWALQAAMVASTLCGGLTGPVDAAES